MISIRLRHISCALINFRQSFESFSLFGIFFRIKQFLHEKLIRCVLWLLFVIISCWFLRTESSIFLDAIGRFNSISNDSCCWSIFLNIGIRNYFLSVKLRFFIDVHRRLFVDVRGQRWLDVDNGTVMILHVLLANYVRHHIIVHFI